MHVGCGPFGAPPPLTADTGWRSAPASWRCADAPVTANSQLGALIPVDTVGNDARRGSDGPRVQETGSGERQLREGPLEISPVPVAILADRQVVCANDRAKQESGFREDELLGPSPADSALSAIDADGNPIDDEGITVETLERGEPVWNRVCGSTCRTGD